MRCEFSFMTKTFHRLKNQSFKIFFQNLSITEYSGLFFAPFDEGIQSKFLICLFNCSLLPCRHSVEPVIP